MDALGGLHVAVMVAGEILVLTPLYGNGRKEARGLAVPWRVEEYRLSSSREYRGGRWRLAGSGTSGRGADKIPASLCIAASSTVNRSTELGSGVGAFFVGFFCAVGWCASKPGRPCSPVNLAQQSLCSGVGLGSRLSKSPPVETRSRRRRRSIPKPLALRNRAP